MRPNAPSQERRWTFLLVRGLWWACQDLNLGPHPYQGSRAQPCADRPFPRLLAGASCWRNAQGKTDEAQLLVWHAEGEELHQLGGCRWVEVAETDHHVAELGEDPQLTVHAGRAPAVPVAAQRSLTLHVKAKAILLLVGAGRVGER